MKIAVYDRMSVGHFVYKAVQKLHFLLGTPFCKSWHPVVKNGLYICKRTLFNICAVQFLCKGNIFFDIFLEFVGIFAHSMTEGIGFKHLKNNTVTVSAFYNIIRDNTRSAVDKRRFCKFSLSFYLFKAYARSVHLYNSIFVNSVNCTVAALAYYIAVRQIYFPDSFFYIENIVKTRYAENIINIGRNIYDRNIAPALFKFKQNAQART